MPDKIVNHFVLADGSTAKYDAGALLNLDDTVSLAGYAPDAKAVRAQITFLNDAVQALPTTITTDLDNVTTGYWSITNSNTGIVAKSSDTNYYTLVNPLDISEFKVGTTIDVNASLVGARGVYICDTNMVALEYVNGNNATEKGYSASSEIKKITVTIPENAKYLMTALRTTYYTDETLFSVSGTMENAIDRLSSEIEELDGEINAGLVKIEQTVGKNLYNPQDATVGLINQNGSVDNNTSYVTSDYIPILAGQSVTTTAKIRRFLAFDTNKDPITTSYVNGPTIGSYTYTATLDGFIRASFYASATVFQIEYGTEVTTPQPYNLTDRIEDEIYPSKTISENVGNILYGKKWVAVGDSFTEGLDTELLTDGKYEGEHGCYPYIIGNNTGIDVVKFFRGGRTMAYPSGGAFTNSFCCPTDKWYYQNIPEDTDYLTIMLGINDVNHESGSGTTPDGEDATGVITLGTIDDTTTATYYGAWNTVVTWLLENRPYAHIGIIVTNGTQSQGFTEAQINIAKKYGLPYLNLNGDQFTRAMLRCYNPDIPANIKELIKQKQAVDYDGSITGSVNIHPNTYAHKLESTFIENFLRSL